MYTLDDSIRVTEMQPEMHDLNEILIHKLKLYINTLAALSYLKNPFITECNCNYNMNKHNNKHDYCKGEMDNMPVPEEILHSSQEPDSS